VNSCPNNPWLRNKTTNKLNTLMMNELDIQFNQINSKIDLVVLQLLIIGGATYNDITVILL